MLKPTADILIARTVTSTNDHNVSQTEVTVLISLINDKAEVRI